MKWGKTALFLEMAFLCGMFSQRKPTKVSKERLNSHLEWKRGLRVFLSPLVINYPGVNIGHRGAMVSQRCAHSMLTREVLFKRCAARPPSALPHV